MARWCLPKAAYIPALGHLGPAASERKLKRRKIYGFSVAAGPAAAVRLTTVPRDDLVCNNPSHCELCKRLELHLVDGYGNPADAAADDDDVPVLRVRLEGPLTGAPLVVASSSKQ